MKKDLTKEKLLKLGFKENVVTSEESNDKEYRYYTLDLKVGYNDCLISNADDEIENGFFTVNLFNSDLGYCYNSQEVKNLYKTLKRKKLCV